MHPCGIDLRPCTAASEHNLNEKDTFDSICGSIQLNVSSDSSNVRGTACFCVLRDFPDLLLWKYITKQNILMNSTTNSLDQVLQPLPITADERQHPPFLSILSAAPHPWETSALISSLLLCFCVHISLPHTPNPEATSVGSNQDGFILIMDGAEGQRSIKKSWCESRKVVKSEAEEKQSFPPLISPF